MIKDILKKYCEDGWTGTAIARHYQDIDPRVTKRTVYELARRVRNHLKRGRKLSKSVDDLVESQKHRPGPKIKPSPFVPAEPVETGVVTQVDSEIYAVDGAIAVPSDEPAQCIERTKAFLRSRAKTAHNLLDTSLAKARTVSEEDDPALLNVALQAAHRAADLARKLSGTEDEVKAGGGSNGSKHMHFHMSRGGGL